MIVVTGAAGFIGSCMVQKLNDEGHSNLVLVDDFSSEQLNRNFAGKQFALQVDRDEFLEWLKQNHTRIDFIFHIGARTDTSEFDYEVFNRLNLDYTKALWLACVEYGLSLVYASSAATYGLGEQGYDDDVDKIPALVPLNVYGESKNDFDKWALRQENKPPFWAGLKFFNVYGPNEYHKGRMASVIFHTYNQIQQNGSMKLFQSHRQGIRDGEQKRDFIYIKDVIDVLYFFLTHRTDPGIYNLGTGRARTFLDLATNTFKALNKAPSISFIPTPEDIREKYQFFTEAKMNRLRSIGYHKTFYSLEDGIDDYVKNYLVPGKYF